MARRLPIILFLLIATAAEASMRSLSSTDININNLPRTVSELFSDFTSSSAPGMAPSPSIAIPSELKDKSLNELFAIVTSKIRPSSPAPTSDVLNSVDAATLAQMASAVNASGLAASATASGSSATPAAATTEAAAPPPTLASSGVSVTVTSAAVYSIAVVGGFAMFL